jgi:FkbM family methyltransferase
MKLTSYQRFLQYALMRIRPSFIAAWLKPLLGVKRLSAETPHGTFWVDPVSVLGITLTNEGIYEAGMIKTLEKFLRPGCCFVDLGANEGYFTVIGARLCGEAGRVIAIEPQHRLLPVIEENVRVNSVPNVTLVNVAVGDETSTVEMQLTPSTNNGGSGFGRSTRYRLPTQQVSMQTLAQVLESQSAASIDLLKVDIEGFEFEALLGSPQVFEQHRVRALALELHPTILSARGKDVGEIERMLDRCGYRCEETFGNSVWLAPES